MISTEVFSWVVAILVIVLVAVWKLWRDTRRQLFDARTDFLRLSNTISTFLTQQDVDRVLSLLAWAFHQAAQTEISALVRKDAGKFLAELEGIQRLVKMYKEAFWSAHELAKERGYAVRVKYTDYLTAE